MEAVGTGSRQSGILSIINHEQVDRIIKDIPDRAYTSERPTSIYPSHPPPYSSGYQALSATHAMSSLTSPPESRRTSGHKCDPPAPSAAPPHRQSLPSIHEALGASKPNSFAPPPVPAPLPTSQQQYPQPYSQPQAPSIPRSYATDHALYQPQGTQPPPRHASPQPVHHQTSTFSRTDSIPASFSDNARHTSIHAAPPPPPNPYAGPHYEPSRYEQAPRPLDRLPQSNGYTHQPPPQAPYGYASGPGQMPQPEYHAPSPFSQQRYHPRDEREPGDVWKDGREDIEIGDRRGYAPILKRHLDVFDFEDNLAVINASSFILRDWSAHFHKIAQEQQRSMSTVPERMPQLDECNSMLLEQDKIMHALQRMKETIQQQKYAMEDQRMREQGGKGPGEYDPDEMSIYGDDMKNQGFGASEAKKRRGRAAPPGRCHSCNRAETPEWRRGPDGARTLCNACGLHYAKLTRKNGMKQAQGVGGSSLRPKSIDEHSPRPQI